jgi:hypothetical protein
MIDYPETTPRRPSASWNVRIAVITLLIVVIAVSATAVFVMSALSNPNYQPLPFSAHTPYPRGVVDIAEPSGVAPPGVNALSGFVRTYVTDFNGTSLTSGWDVFTGIPAGDPGGKFASSHVVVSDGLLQLSTWKDPQYQNRWVTGGLCQCGLSRVYGAYFIRSRVTSDGPNQVELLWPADNQWPPEIDFNETQGGALATTWTIHYGPINQVDQGILKIDMTQWHTWGVIWTAKSITYTVDGTVWGSTTNPAESPTIPMNLDFEQRTLCSTGRQCPTTRVSMLIDWVAEYSKKAVLPDW